MITLTLPSGFNLYSETVIRTAVELNGFTRLSFPGIDRLVELGIVVTPVFATILNNSDQTATEIFITKDSELANCSAFSVDPGGAGNCFYQQEGGFSYMVCSAAVSAVYLAVVVNTGAGSLTFTMYYTKATPII